MGLFNGKEINLKKTVVIKFETTGLNPTEDKILRFTAIDGHGAVVMDQLINPLITDDDPVVESWKNTIKFHGITQKSVSHEPFLGVVIKKIEKIINEAQCVVSYTNLEEEFMKAKGFHIDYDKANKFFIMLVGHFGWKKLNALIKEYGFSVSATQRNTVEKLRATLFLFYKWGEDENVKFI